MARIVAWLIALLVTLGLSAPAIAQDVTPAAGLPSASELGVNELNVTATDKAFEGVPADLKAGFYLVNLTNNSSQTITTTFMELPANMTLEQFMAMFGPASASPTSEYGTPSATEGTPTGGEMNPPDWYYTTRMAGGPGALVGQSTQAIVLLQAGSWIFWGDDPTAPQRPVEITVTGDVDATPMAAGLTATNADLTIDEVATADGYRFQLTGALQPGKQMIQVVNQSDQPHFVIFLKSPGPISRDQVRQLLESDMTGTPNPDPNMPNPEDIEDIAGIGTMSSGTTA